jgi:hypothetical protein
VTLLLWGAGVLLVVTLLVMGLRLGIRPAYYRSRGPEFLEEMVGSLAASPEGSVLLMEHPGSGRFLQFRKPADTGQKRQRVVFGFPEVAWTEPFFDQVVEEIERSGFPCEIVERTQDGQITRFVEVTLEGEWQALGRDAHGLVRPLLSILGFQESDRFTFHVDAPYFDEQLQARVNMDLWQSGTTRGPQWFRRYAARKVRLGQSRRV